MNAMWCDDFDMDLPKVVPDARRALGDRLANLELTTYGNITNGTLNHPAVWNHSLGMIAFFGRPGRIGKPAPYYVGGHHLVHCTLWEALRDAWCHDVVILFEGVPVWDGPGAWRHFEKLMYHVRGWKTLPESEAMRHRVAVLDMIVRCGEAVDKLVAASTAEAGQ